MTKSKATYPELKVGEKFNSRACPIAAFEYVGFNPNKVINMISYEDNIYENTPNFYTVETLRKNTTDSYFPLMHYSYINDATANSDYLITDKSTRNNKPLFYQYELLYDVSLLETDGSISIYKNNEVLVSKDLYDMQFSYDLISSAGRYTSTSWVPRDPTKKVHRVRLLLPIEINSTDFYTVSYKKSVFNAVTDQRELLELKSVYTNADFAVSSNGINLTVSSKVSLDTTTLYIAKNPDKRIIAIGIDPPVSQYDNLTSWFLRFNAGSFYITPGEFNTDTQLYYYLSNVYNSVPTLITDIKPVSVTDDIIRVGQVPIYIDDSKYQFSSVYTIGSYDGASESLSETAGGIGILVNGNTIPDLKILSIDREKGYIHVNKILDPTDNITLNFYVNNSQYIAVNNLELNPKSNRNTLFHISGYFNGLGIAMRPYVAATDDTHLLYIYDVTQPESSRVCKSIPAIGGASSNINWTSDSFISLCELHLNRLSKDMVQITDARRIGGGITDISTLKTSVVGVSGLDPHELDWYSNVGYYGGEPLSIGGSIIIHIPSGILYGARDQWIESISRTIDDPMEALDKGTKEFNFYLDQVIKRYISAGTNYAIVPIDNSGNFMDIVTLDF